jgi:hypothetical protein
MLGCLEFSSAVLTSPLPLNSASCRASVLMATAVCDQKIYKFFVSRVAESIAGHMGINRIY